MKPTKRITIDCFDNGGKTADRYTIIIDGLGEQPYCLGASSNPYHPQGIGQHCEMKPGVYHIMDYDFLGKRIGFFELPADVRRFIANEFMPEG